MLQFRIQNKFLLLNMNIPLFQDQGVSCNCFYAAGQDYRSGLKPSKGAVVRIQNPSSQRATKSSEARIHKDQSSRIKTSLKREKPKTPIFSSTHIQAKEQQIECRNLNQRISFHQQPQIVELKWNNINQAIPFINSHSPQTKVLPTHSLNLQQKRTNLIRNQPIKQIHQPIKIDPNFIQSKAIQIVIPKRQLKVNFVSPVYIPTAIPLRQTLQSQRQRNEKKINFQDPTFQTLNLNLRMSRQSKKCSLKSSERKQKSSVTHRHQPFIMMLKQIQSVVDENDRHEDQMSQVIGRGWEYDRQSTFSQFNKDQRLRTETHATRASNIKNSSTIYSTFGISESHLRR